jgi:hypothetical protein
MLGNLERDFRSCEPLSPGANVAETEEVSHSCAFVGILLAAEPGAGLFAIPAAVLLGLM